MIAFKILFACLEMLSLASLFLILIPLAAHIRPDLIRVWVMRSRPVPSPEGKHIFVSIFVGSLFVIGLIVIVKRGSTAFLDRIPKDWGSVDEDDVWTSARDSIGYALAALSGLGGTWMAQNYWYLLERDRNNSNK